jgi:hypothetical protein
MLGPHQVSRSRREGALHAACHTPSPPSPHSRPRHPVYAAWPRRILHPPVQTRPNSIPSLPLLLRRLASHRGTRFYLGRFCSSPGACYQRPALAVSNMFQLPSHQLMSRHPYRPWWGPPPISPLFPSHPSMRLTTSDSYSLPRSARCIQSTMPSRPESPPRVAAQSRRPESPPAAIVLLAPLP